MSASSRSGVSVDVSPLAADRPLPVAPTSLAVGPPRLHDTMFDLIIRRFLRHRLAGWQDISQEDLVASLESLRELALSPVEA